MRLIIDFNKEYVIEKVKTWIITLITFVYGWFTHEGEVLGYILGVFHITISITIGIFIILSHTIYPEFYLQLGVFLCLLVIWIQHLIFNICIVIVAEQGLTKNESPYTEFVKTFLDYLKIDINQFPIYFMITETIAVFLLGLEIISRCSFYLQRFLRTNNDLYFW
jgi:hypothetical protein